MVSLFLGIQIDWAGIGASILQVLRTACGYLAGYIYDFIAVLYNLFMFISRAEILNSAFVNEIYRKVGLILGIFMVFKLSFSAIQALVDPNKFNDKKNGFTNVILRCVVCIVLLGITPTIFKEAFALQSLLIGANNSSDNIIYKLIIGQNVGNVENFGTTLAGELFFSFYTDDVDPRLDYAGSYHPSQVGLWNDIKYKDLRENFVNPPPTQTPGSFTSTVEYLSAVDSTGEYYIEFNIIFSILFGVITAWMLAMYCIQAGIRVVQLAYLQLIAPVPIFSYISDPDGAFKKWIQQCVTTYLDLFIRLAIIYFVLFLAKNIMLQLDPDNANSLLMTSTGLSPNSPYLVWVKVFLILGLLLFAKKVPELLKDLFPNLGGGAGKFSFGLNPKKEVFEPLKHMYNNTPLGWAPKALGWVGKKTIGGIDRKVHGLPKSRNKLQQYFDKLAPGHAEAIKNRNKAILDRKQDEKYEAEGQALYNRYGDDLPVSAFGSKEYRDSYTKLAEAKELQKKADEEYRDELEQYKRAYNSGNEEAIRIAKSRIKTAESNQKAMASKVELAQKKHDANKRIYTRDAAIEDKHSYYKKTHKQIKNYTESQFDYSSLSQPQPQPAQQQPVRQQSVQQQPAQQPSPEIEVVNEIRNNSRYKEEEQAKVYAQVKAEVDEANRQNSSNISSASGLSQEQLAAAESYRQEIEKLINYKKNARDPKDIQEIDMEIEAKTKELNKLIGKE